MWVPDGPNCARLRALVAYESRRRVSLELARIPALEGVPTRLGRVPATAPAPHSERVSLSDGSQSASQDLASPQTAVRWYRAAVTTVRRTGLAPELVTDADARRAAPATIVPAAARGVLAALTAYRAAMALGA